LNLFIKGLKNSSKDTGDLEPAGLVSCLKMAKYCLTVSPGFLPRNPSTSIFVSKSEDGFFQITIPLDFSRMNLEESDPYKNYKCLIARVDYNDSSNARFSLLEREPRSFLSSIFLVDIPLEITPIKELVDNVHTKLKEKKV